MHCLFPGYGWLELQEIYLITNGVWSPTLLAPVLYLYSSNWCLQRYLTCFQKFHLILHLRLSSKVTFKYHSSISSLIIVWEGLLRPGANKNPLCMNFVSSITNDRSNDVSKPRLNEEKVAWILFVLIYSRSADGGATPSQRTLIWRRLWWTPSCYCLKELRSR